MTQWLMGVQRCCWMLGSPTTSAVCLEGPNRRLWSSGLRMVCLWTGLPAPLWAYATHAPKPTHAHELLQHLICLSLLKPLVRPPFVLKEVLADRKRVTTRSYLPIQPVDTDTGRNYSCVATNLAIPTGKSTTVTLNVHRKQRSVVSSDYSCISIQ